MIAERTAPTVQLKKTWDGRPCKPRRPRATAQISVETSRRSFSSAFSEPPCVDLSRHYPPMDTSDQTVFVMREPVGQASVDGMPGPFCCDRLIASYADQVIEKSVSRVVGT